MKQRLSSVSVWQAEPVHDEIKACAVEHEVGMGKVAQPIRVAVTGTTISPPLDATLAVLGQEKTLAAIDQALRWLEQTTAN
jgi:glutamyl-tRNA synthetase